MATLKSRFHDRDPTYSYQRLSSQSSHANSPIQIVLDDKSVCEMVSREGTATIVNNINNRSYDYVLIRGVILF